MSGALGEALGSLGEAPWWSLDIKSGGDHSSPSQIRTGIMSAKVCWGYEPSFKGGAYP